jgi:hypothetical protein
LAGLGLALVTPYAALLPLDFSRTETRYLYLSPLLFSAAWAVLDLGPVAPAARLGAAVCLGLIVTGDVRLSWQLSGLYPRLYEDDRAELRAVDDLARSSGASELCLFVYPGNAGPPTRSIDPQNLGPEPGDVRLSALLGDGSAQAFSRWFSSLTVLDEDAVSEGCSRLCLATHANGFHAGKLPGRPTVCLCPP